MVCWTKCIAPSNTVFSIPRRISWTLFETFCVMLKLVEMNEANAWLDKLMESAPSGYYKSEYMKVKARILRVLGKVDEANELELQAPKVRMS